MGGAMPVDAEAILEKPEERLAEHHAAEPGQIRFALDGVGEHRKCLAETLIAELVGLCCTGGGANDVVRVQRRPSWSQRRPYAVEHAQGAGSMWRRCGHGIDARRGLCPTGLRRVARPPIRCKA
jgi:hypothetical protein